jgi:uncharacterized protein YkwD
MTLPSSGVRKLRQVAVLLIVFVLGTACTPGVQVLETPEDSPEYSAADLERLIQEMINRERSSAGLRRLAQDSALADIARGHSRDMAVRDYFSHVDPVHGTPTDRAAAAGYVCEKRDGDVVYSGVAENIAMQHTYSRATSTVSGGVRSRAYEWSEPAEIAEAVVQGWMQSPGHRANIVDPRSDRQGVGVHIQNQRVFVTQKLC